MTYAIIRIGFFTLFCQLISESLFAQNNPILQFEFDENVKSENYQFNGQEYGFVNGIDGQALALDPDKGYNNLDLNNVALDGTKDFSIQFWIKTTSINPTVFLSQKIFNNKSITCQKNAGWVLYSSDGTFAFSIGSGERRINYERENGEKMPVNDGEWHLISLTYSKELSEFRLYYDGYNKAVYKVNFEFENTEPIVIGSIESSFDYESKYSPDIESGLDLLQAYVDEFNSLGLEPLKNEELIDLIVDPEMLFDNKPEIHLESKKAKENDLSKALEIRKKLVSNPYTVFQNRELTDLKPVSVIYALQDGKVVINESAGRSYTMDEKLYPSDFAMDKLSVWDQVISAEEVLDSYKNHKDLKPAGLVNNLNDLTVGVWNIWHGGIHWSLENDGWDSRLRIVEMIKDNSIDVVLMQETYSSGDFIAAELGYYYSTTSDWDYRSQGENISVISRFPIKEINVSAETEFNNVGVKLVISKTQEIWAMSNWYGMSQFPVVFDFHKSRFANADNIPVIFGGDFNAVPHTDGGDSPASKIMMEEGFTDAFRSLFPDAEEYPGLTHQSGVRIDQLYYKGKGLNNISTKVISSWPAGFPSDHYLIVSKFELDYESPKMP
jgi:exonuclease III